MKQLLKTIIVTIVTLEAKIVLKKYKPQIVVVTGSVGKTSTKDAVAAVLERHFYIRKSQKSFNSETGVPLTILGCTNPWNNYALWLKVMLEGFFLCILPNHYPKLLVLEVGADKPGDVQSMMKWIEPDIVVVTRLSEIPVHVEAYISPHATREEEFYPATVLKNEGTLIYCRDDSYAVELAKGISAHTLTYGFEPAATVRAEYCEVMLSDDGLPCGMEAKVAHGGISIPAKIYGSVGKHQFYAVLAALATASVLGVSIIDAIESLKNFTPPPGRMRLIPGKKGTQIIDDSYNSSPIAVRAALHTLAGLHVRGRKIMVLGDMLELGTFSIDEHLRIGTEVAEVADILITVGVRARGIAEGAKNAGFKENQIMCFDTSPEAGAYLLGVIEEDDLLLIKGSQTGIRLERAVAVLMEEEERAGELLVRQDKEWKER